MDDYIKRSDALELSRIFGDKLWETGGYRNCITEAVPVKAIKNIPSADVAEVRHGKWIKDEDGCVVCSICSNPDEINGISGEFMYNNFCANCGADMRG